LSINNFINAQVEPYESPKIVRRYGVTADILSYLRCKRRYGYFRARGFSPASTVQLFFGTIIHQVLDKAHLHYSGLLPSIPKGSLPNDLDIEIYFEQVENALKAQGIRGMSGTLRTTALSYIKIFNRIWGPKLYPRVVDTEHLLRMNRNIKGTIDYVLKGVVDVLVNKVGGSTNPSDVEIWDYKGSKIPQKNSPDFKNYEFQMQVYAELYHFRHGVFPNKAVLVFIGELGNITVSSVPNIEVAVPLNSTKINNAMSVFENKVEEIEDEHLKPFHLAWEAPKTPPEKDTCNACDLRWSCKARKGQYPMRAP